MLNKQHLPVLRAARALIDQGEEIFTCFALAAVGDERPELRDICTQIRVYVMDQLDGDCLLSGWTLHQMFGCEDDWPAQYVYAWNTERGIFTLARLAWIDRMIADIEALPC